VTQQHQEAETLSRRDFLSYTLPGVAMVGAGMLVGGSLSDAKAQTAASPKISRGGRLRVGVLGGGPADTLDVTAGSLNTDLVRGKQLVETLTTYDPQGNLKLWLAEELTADPDARAWTIRLRKDITLHNGKTLGAEDVLFTFRRLLTNRLPGRAGVAQFDLQNAKIVDPRTLRLPTVTPYSTFPEMVAGAANSILPVDFDPKKPVGTGPFKVDSFTPGQQSVFVKNENYWGEGLPYLDSVVIINFADETSMVNALQANQVDCITPLSNQSVAALRSARLNILIAEGSAWLPFVMRVDVAPFNEVEVRRACKLMIDRPAMRRAVFGGRGRLGNDIFGINDPAYDRNIPQREQDIPQAKALLKKHGVSELNVTLVTSDIHQGAVPMATVFKEQAQKAGVNITLQSVPPGTLYGPRYLSWEFTQDFSTAVSYLRCVGRNTVKQATTNATHFNDPRYQALYEQALATVDQRKRTELIQEMQRIDWNDGGLIIPVFTPAIDGYRPQLVDPIPDATGQGLGGYDFKNFSFKSS
jgi:peptide/nickel transport system substrate-binding protein